MIPFFGGVAAPKRPYDSDAQLGFVALMGPGFSLLPTAALFFYAQANESLPTAHAAALFAVINGANLVPVSPLDGGVILKCLLGTMSRSLGRAVAWLGTLAGLAFSLYVGSALLAIVFLFSAMQLATQKSLDMETLRRRLSLNEAAGLSAAFAIVALAYVWLSVSAIWFERELEYRASGSTPAAADSAEPQ